MAETLLQIKNLKKHFTTKKGLLYAVDGINFDIQKGETLGLVGESGCGKSTAGRTIIRLIQATSGDVFFKDMNVLHLKKHQMKELRKKMQIVFQDPYSCLNPRLTVDELIAEPLYVNKTYKSKLETKNQIKKLMSTVGLAQRLINSYPHELDGGRRQRVGIARALALNPEFIVLDEPVSALDVCVQAQVLNLLKGLQSEFGLTYLFISHNLSVVKHMSNRIAVMYLGKIVEMAHYKTMFEKPLHPYTQALLSAVPIPKLDVQRKRIILEGDIPSPVNPPPGCRFAGRCKYRQQLCMEKEPLLTAHDSGSSVACHFVDNLNSL
ncbi:MAG: ATP-binding cassette domain-containing protein [Chitinivibrionales bacterium]|nr:ATP-binding cassette domain-containing protein [Chitinivibrionales bacterium]